MGFPRVLLRATAWPLLVLATELFAQNSESTPQPVKPSASASETRSAAHKLEVQPFEVAQIWSL